MNYQKEIDYLQSKDARLAIIMSHELEIIHADHDIYGALMSAIISQQISTAAASSIRRRFLEYFKNPTEKDEVYGYPDIETVLNTSIETFKSLGLSNSKANYIKNVASFYKDYKLTSLNSSAHKEENVNQIEIAGNIENVNQVEKVNRELATGSDIELIANLTTIKGVGRWTVEMMLIFKLAREDVFALDDLGLVNGVVSLYDLKRTKTLKKRIGQISKNWSPYRSIVSRYVWSCKDRDKLKARSQE